jgi:hypothetical protein
MMPFHAVILFQGQPAFITNYDVQQDVITSSRMLLKQVQ